MLIIGSKNSVPIRISQERWAHITRRHPEMSKQKDKVVDTLSAPGAIYEGDFGALLAVRFYPRHH